MLFFTGYRAYRRSSTTGQAALSTIFIIGGIVVFASLTIAFFALSFLNATFGAQAANRAEAVAMGGLNDTLLKLARNRSYAVASLSVSIDNYTALVSATQDSPVAGQVTITSSATVNNNTRQVLAVATVSTSTGEVTLLRWQLQ
ncbi:MAG TPA: hypothetical protein VMC43_01840 [Candidatus Paceibacterota bacterium]|nr:hypothetical protein [Candidatus Paceibacterota bacterium]